MNAANTVALDLAPMMSWIVAAMTIINFLILLKGIMSSGEKEIVAKLQKVETKLIDHDRRIQTVESDTKHLPDKDSVHKQQLDIVEMKGEIGSIKKSIEATERTTRRVEDFLMKGSA